MLKKTTSILMLLAMLATGVQTAFAQTDSRDDRALARGVNMAGGKCTYEAVANVWGLPFTPLADVIPGL